MNLLKNNFNYIIYSYVILFFLFFIFSSKIFFNHFYFPIDDAYIITNQAFNLIDGYFFQYSIFDEPNNSNSSVLFYLINAIFLKIISFFFNDRHLILETLVLVNSVFNFILIIVLINILKRFLILFEYQGSKNILLFLIISSLPVIYPFISGLETGLTTTLILCQLYLFLKNKNILFIILTLILSINRPENIILNFLYVILFFLKSENKKIDIIYSLIIFFSLSIVPLLNYSITGDLRTASASRVGLTLDIPILFERFINFFSTSFSYPNWLPEGYHLYFKILKNVFSTIFILIIIFSTIKIYTSYRLNKLNNIFIKDSYIYFFIVSLLVIGSYSLVPFIATNYGEWGRYISPILPIFFVLFFSSCQYFKKTILFFVILVNIILIPLYFISHINIISIIDSILKPAAIEIYKISKKNDVVAIDSAGYISNFINGNVIDVYGLGTTRYMKIKTRKYKTYDEKFEKVYEQLRMDNINFVITWKSDEEKFYLDSKHYSNAFGSDNLKQLKSFKVNTITEIEKSFPNFLSIYMIDTIN